MAKATYCGRCGTTHVPPSQGGKCPALKNEEVQQIDEIKVGDFVKPNMMGGEVHRVFGRDGNSLSVGKYHGPNQYGGTKTMHVTKVVKVKKPMKESSLQTFSQFVSEAHDVELKPHPNGTHYVVHKIHPSSGIESDQLKKGEKISDTHVDDLHDMGYKVKIHK